MAKKDPRVDAYISKSADFARPILEHLRQLVHNACPDVEETLKWQFPHFLHKGILCSMAAFKSHCAFGFWHKLMRDAFDPDRTLDGMGHMGRICTMSDLPTDTVLTRHLKRAIKLNDQGVKGPAAKPAPKKPLKVPAHVMGAMKKNAKARSNFEAMSPSHQREYVEWITEAKREETITKRLTTMLEWLAEGKSRNWKYER